MTIQQKNKIIEDMNNLFEKDKNIDNVYNNLQNLGIEVINFVPTLDFESKKAKSKVEALIITTQYSFKINEKVFNRKNNISELTYSFNKNNITIENIRFENETDLSKNHIKNTISYSQNDKKSWIRKLENDINTNIRVFEKTIYESTKQITYALESKYLAKKIVGKNAIDTFLKNYTKNKKQREINKTKDYVENKIKVAIEDRIYKFDLQITLNAIQGFYNVLSLKTASISDMNNFFKNQNILIEEEQEMVAFEKEILTYLTNVIDTTYFDLLKENYQLQVKFNLENDIEEDLENSNMILVTKKQLKLEVLKRLKQIFSKFGQNQNDYDFR